MPLHARKMVPPVLELIEEQKLVTTTSEVEDVYERDEKTGVLVRVGKTKAVTTTTLQPTGKLVKYFETVGENGKPVLHEGSMKQVDLHCGDCGSMLKPANDRDFYYLLCSRLNERKHEQYQAVEERDVEGEDGVKHRKPVLLTWALTGDEPYENCVLECGNEPTGSPD